MCGVIFSFPSHVEFNRQQRRVTSAMNMLQHRGPDEGNIKQLENAYIAHQRLSIIDLSQSHQPMKDPTGRFYLSYNGEIYNYKQLRKQLMPHWQFSTNGDTEVILAGLITEGESFVRKMEGMWAFALWDTLKQQLFLSRDRLGKKPLYYYSTNNEFHCASEIPALLSLLENRPAEDTNSRTDYLKYGYFLPGYTIYKGLFEVLPGNNLWLKNKQLSQNQYWQLGTQKTTYSKQEALEQLNDKLHESVKKRLIADVEVGAFLSGGIDSSLIVALAQKQMNTSLKTFTIGFEEASFDETKYAQQIADLYKTEHYSKILPAVSYEQLEGLISNHIGQPFADPSLLPTAVVSQTAAQHVKVALSGDGADELFSGYQRYTSRAILHWYNKLPAKIKKNVESVIRAIPEPHQHHSASLIKKAHLFADISNRLDSETPYIAPLYFSKNEFEKLSIGDWSKGHTIPSELEETALDDISRMMYADTLVYLPQDILLKVDRASMAASLETRAPFLDHQVVELALSLPVNWHRGALTGKQMLKQGFNNYLPNNIWKRRKQGFATPQSMWFKQNLDDIFFQLLDEIKTPFDHQKIRQLLIEHRSNNRDVGGKLWLLFSYFIWRKSLDVH